ncbi:TIGR02266 family protein [Vitiosangium sp. GDMCC 1.1324]|uniref:TIGR02266 family protein n=1 Tax=Vitiosangium sp. (strain GDMCC 1.1324) TaxID=2138576 RepID=UPI001E3C1914|nr:TIGR02266 family protein [Vitiosangium sp. GDMCC 1.1324]
MSNYWIGDSIGRVLGPLTLQSLRDLIGSGRLKAVTRASRDGSTWEPIEHFNEVKDLLSAAGADPATSGLQQAERLRQQLRQMEGLPAHQLFGVKPDAPLEELRGAFFRLAKRFSPEHQGPDTHPELRKVSAEVFELLARRMRELEAQSTPSQGVRAAAPHAARGGQQAPAYRYSAEEFVGLQMRNDRLQIEIKVNARNAGIFTDHRIINLQAGGLFIPTDKPIRLGTRVDLVLNFEQQQRQIKLRSSVIWEYTLDDGKQPRGYGLGLADLRAEERTFVDEFLRANRVVAPTSSR